MKTQSASSLHFQRKISDFCDVRIAPLVSRRTLENIKPYLSSLILYRKHPPTRMGRIDWRSVSDACGLEDAMTPALKKGLQPGLEAIIRWIDQERPVEHDRPMPTPPIERARSTSPKPTVKPSKSSVTPRLAMPTEPRAGSHHGRSRNSRRPSLAGLKNPSDFREALNYHMGRHGDTYWHLHRAVAGDHPTFAPDWIRGLRLIGHFGSCIFAVERLLLMERYWLVIAMPEIAAIVSI
ncbi:hypothetical protein [Ensifer adhaerens]|uniref:hypothetical protein n=1 Tax=Ensifer adhaerens TaxID=106592 RepID=UPI001146E158|nr:hypothetical protein [Ensifer adhaerens]